MKELDEQKKIKLLHAKIVNLLEGEQSATAITSLISAIVTVIYECTESKESAYKINNTTHKQIKEFIDTIYK